jgi:hypothetical protein
MPSARLAIVSPPGNFAESHATFPGSPGEDEAADAIAEAVGDHHLRPAPVVEAESDLAQIERVEELRDDVPQTVQREIGFRMHRYPVRAHRESGEDAAIVVTQLVDDVPPLGTAHRQPVDEDELPPVAARVLILDRSRRQCHLWHALASTLTWPRRDVTHVLRALDRSLYECTRCMTPSVAELTDETEAR